MARMESVSVYILSGTPVSVSLIDRPTCNIKMSLGDMACEYLVFATIQCLLYNMKFWTRLFEIRIRDCHQKFFGASDLEPYQSVIEA